MTEKVNNEQKGKNEQNFKLKRMLQLLATIHYKLGWGSNTLFTQNGKPG